jgi:hypothetical protein
MNISHVLANCFMGLVAFTSVVTPFAMAAGLVTPA